MATVFSGGTYVNATFTGDSRGAIMANIAAQLVNAGWTSRAIASGQGLGNRGTATITIASPGVVTFTAHGFLGGEKIVLTTTGALPTGLAVNTVYFVKYIDANTFNLAATLGGANINTSGSQSGTHTLNTESYLMECVAQPNVTNPMRVRLWDTKVNCACVTIENYAGTLVGTTGTSIAQGGFLLPGAGKIWRILATRYHFYVIVPGSASLSREFVMAGMPYVDSSILTGVTDIGYMFSNSYTDSNSTNTYNTFRTNPGMSSCGNYCVLYNTALWQSSNSNGSLGNPDTLFTCPPGLGQIALQRHYRWANDDLLTSDILVSWGATTVTDEAKIRGQFFDLIYIADAFNMDTTTSEGGHNYYNLTNNNQASADFPRGGMWVATS